VAPHAQYCCDLSYVGTYAEDRQAILQELFLTPARALPQHRFLIAGAQYPGEFPWLENVFFVRHIAPPDHAALYSSSRLTLNLTRHAMARSGYCPSGRLFEAAACGTPVLSDDWPGLEEFFEPGREILVAHHGADVLEALVAARCRVAPHGDARTRARARRAQRRKARHRLRDFARGRPTADREVELMLGIVPAAGAGSRIQPLAFSKELLPVGSRRDGSCERPRAVSEYLLERMIRADVSKICFVIAPGKSDILEYFGAKFGTVRLCYTVQAEPAGLCDAIFSALPLVHASEPVLVGLPDTIWFPIDGLRVLPDDIIIVPAVSCGSSTVFRCRYCR
jgi:hypothetical protein